MRRRRATSRHEEADRGRHRIGPRTSAPRHGRTHLVLLGIATSGVVLSTARWAADADYTMNIVCDCCFDRNPEVHRVLIEKVLVAMAPPITAAEFVEALA